jgi:pimeloyl-ACP methyl ester carboxylesterase
MKYLRLVSFLVVVVSGLLSAQEDKMAQTYILVHGSFAGSWSWDEVKKDLEAAGNTVIAVDLPGRTGDTTPFSNITLQSFVDTVVKVLDEQAQPVIVVGHSAGGATISQAAEARPDKVKSLVYVAAYLLQNGQSVNSIAMTDAGSVLGPKLVFDQATLALSIPPNDVKPLFLTDVPEPLLSEAAAKVQAEPGIPGNTPIAITDANYGRIPRYYVTTLNDKVISPETQKAMYTATSVEQVFELNTGHCPFASMPKELTAILTGIQ